MHFFLRLLVVAPAVGGLFPACEEAGCIQNVKELASKDLAELKEPQKLWIVLFYATWCGHCQMFAPVFQEATAEFVGQHAVQFGGFDCSNGCSDYANSYPTIRMFSKDTSKFGKVISVDHTKTAVIEATNRIIAAAGIVEPSAPHEDSHPAHIKHQRGAQEKNVEWTAAALSATRTTHFWDAHVAVIQSMANSLFLHANGKPLTDAKWDAAKEYVSFAARHFPGDYPMLNDRLYDFDTFLRSTKPESEGAWKSDVMARYSNVMHGMTYESCKTYTCALWNLFHILAQRVDTEESDKIEFFEFLTNFATNFFGCSECKDHFLSMLESTKEEGYLWRPSLWVWNAHNAATVRIYHGKRSRWPPTNICADCWETTLKPDRERIALFLQQHYGHVQPTANTSNSSGSHAIWCVFFLLVIVLVAKSSKQRRKFVNFLIRTISGSSKVQSFPSTPLGIVNETLGKELSGDQRHAFHVFGDDIENSSASMQQRNKRRD